MTEPLDLKTITDMIAEITGPNTTAIAQDVKAAAEALGGTP